MRFKTIYAVIFAAFVLSSNISFAATSNIDNTQLESGDVKKEKVAKVKNGPKKTPKYRMDRDELFAPSKVKKWKKLKKINKS